MPFNRFIFLRFFLICILSGNTFSQHNFSPDITNTDSNKRTLLDLNWTEREVTEIGGIIPGKIFLGERASEENFKKYAPDAGIIHLATHTMINEKEPMYSKLIFSPKDTSSEDGLLHTYELYNLDLNANLAVLSACNTGTGKLVRGEGIMSLARGFMYAGCPGIVMSLWPVDDKSTSQIMRTFYSALAQGADKATALRTAKLNYLKNAEDIKAAPYYWSGFVLIGNTNPVELKTKYPLLFWLIPALILALVAFVLAKRRIPNKHIIQKLYLFHK